MSAIPLEELEALSRKSPKKRTTSPTPTTAIPSTENSLIRADSIALPRTNRDFLEEKESLAGGREAFIDTISAATLDKKQQHFLDLLADPRRAKDSISAIAKDSGLTPAQILDLFRSASVARSHTVAMEKLANALPSVVDDIAAKSVDSKIECPLCFGSKTLDGSNCPQCYGKGEVVRYSDLDRQKIILESTGVIKKGPAMNLNVNTQINNLQPSNFFSRFVKDSDSLAYDVGEVIDVTPSDAKS